MQRVRPAGAWLQRQCQRPVRRAAAAQRRPGGPPEVPYAGASPPARAGPSWSGTPTPQNRARRCARARVCVSDVCRQHFFIFVADPTITNRCEVKQWMIRSGSSAWRSGGTLASRPGDGRRIDARPGFCARVATPDRKRIRACERVLCLGVISVVAGATLRGAHVRGRVRAACAARSGAAASGRPSIVAGLGALAMARAVGGACPVCLQPPVPARRVRTDCGHVHCEVRRPRLAARVGRARRTRGPPPGVSRAVRGGQIG